MIIRQVLLFFPKSLLWAIYTITIVAGRSWRSHGILQKAYHGAESLYQEPSHFFKQQLSPQTLVFLIIKLSFFLS